MLAWWEGAFPTLQEWWETSPPASLENQTDDHLEAPCFFFLSLCSEVILFPVYHPFLKAIREKEEKHLKLRQFSSHHLV